MTQDYAKRRQNPAESRPSLPGWVWFITGLATGVFGTFLYFLQDVKTDPETAAIEESPRGEIVAPNVEEMEWDFYDIFPKSEVPVVEEYGPDGTRVEVEEPSAFLLQAGSFRNPEDADRQRAELILLGLDVFVKEVESDGETWHRVLVGPLETEVALSRARRTLAEADVASIALRVTP